MIMIDSTGLLHHQRHGLKKEVSNLVTHIIGVFLLVKKIMKLLILMLVDLLVNMECKACHAWTQSKSFQRKKTGLLTQK
jgi:hypothetical protein